MISSARIEGANQIGLICSLACLECVLRWAHTERLEPCLRGFKNPCMQEIMQRTKPSFTSSVRVFRRARVNSTAPWHSAAKLDSRPCRTFHTTASAFNLVSSSVATLSRSSRYRWPRSSKKEQRTTVSASISPSPSPEREK
jgi:hypothetical protein